MIFNTKENRVEDSQVKEENSVLSKFLTTTSAYNGNPKGEVFNKVFYDKFAAAEIERYNSRVGQSQRDVSYPQGMSPYGAMGIPVASDPRTVDVAMLRNQIAERLLLDFWRKNREKAMKYERMARRPEIADALTVMCNEAMYPNSNGSYASLKISDDAPIGSANKQYLHSIFRNEVAKKMFKLDKFGIQYMRQLLVYGRVFFEIEYSQDKQRIVGLNPLPQHNMLIIQYGGECVGYRQMLESSYVSDMRKANGRNYIDFSPHQVLYLSINEFGPGGDNDPYGVLENVVKTYNQLNAIQDSIVMYRVAWGSERLIFKVDVTGMNKKMAEAHIKEQKNEMSRRLDYNRESGEVTSAGKIMGMSEHFFIPITGTSGSSIDRMPAGSNVSKVEDLQEFRKELINGMQVPTSRITAVASDKDQFNGGKIGSITQDEIKFYRMIMSRQQPFGSAMVKLFTMILALNPAFPDEIINEDFYSVEWSRDNYFQMYLEAEVNSTRFNALAQAKEHIGVLFSKKFVLKHIFKMTDEEEALNELWLQQEQNQGEYAEKPEA